jgi:hypothetical protein
VIAHVGGAPLEETLLPLVNAAGTLVVVAHAWVVTKGLGSGAWRGRSGILAQPGGAKNSRALLSGSRKERPEP